MNRVNQFVLASAASVGLLLGAVGCMHERPEGLSGSAVMAAEGNRTLEYRAPHDGTVTIYDMNADQVIYQGKVTKGQSVMVDTDKNRITLDGQTVSQNALHGGDQNRIFFAPDNQSQTEATVETHSTSVETSHSNNP